jgi:phosphoserine phosphatase
LTTVVQQWEGSLTPGQLAGLLQRLAPVDGARLHAIELGTDPETGVHGFQLGITGGPPAAAAVEAVAQEQGWCRREQPPPGDGPPAGHLLTIMAPGIATASLARVMSLLQEQCLQFDSINTLANEYESGLPRVAFAVRCHGDVDDLTEWRRRLLLVGEEESVDLVWRTEAETRTPFGLIAFDMDSTLIQAEVIDELARMAGVYGEVSAITERAMRGELDFKASFRERLARLRGLPAEAIEEAMAAIAITEGADLLVATLRTRGLRTVILSGGFDLFAERLRQRLGIDEAHTNVLAVANGRVTGEVSGDIVDGARKQALLLRVAERENLPLSATIAVGDGANDLPMLSSAGLGVAFQAKPVVRAEARAAVSQVGLDGVLFLLGIPKSEHRAR